MIIREGKAYFGYVSCRGSDDNNYRINAVAGSLHACCINKSPYAVTADRCTQADSTPGYG